MSKRTYTCFEFEFRVELFDIVINIIVHCANYLICAMEVEWVSSHFLLHGIWTIYETRTNDKKIG